MIWMFLMQKDRNIHFDYNLISRKSIHTIVQKSYISMDSTIFTPCV